MQKLRCASIRLMTAALMLPFLASCGTSQPAACYGGKIIYLAHADLQCMTRATKQEILTNNESVLQNGKK